MNFLIEQYSRISYLPVAALGLCLSMLVLNNASAADSGWYVGGGIGHVSNNLELSDFDDGSLISGDVDTTETAYKLFGGYRINRYLRVESGFVSLRNDLDSETTFTGISDGSGPGFSSFPDGGVSVDIDQQTGFFLALVGSYPLSERWSVTAKIGAFNWDAELTTIDLNGARDMRFDGTDTLYGFGIEHQLRNNLLLRLDVERYADIVDHDFDVAGVGIGYQF